MLYQARTRCLTGIRRSSRCYTSPSSRSLLPAGPRFAKPTPSLSSHVGLYQQRRYAANEPTKINEDDHLEMTRRDKTEGAIMAVQSGLFKLLLPLPNVPEASLAKRMAPKEEDSAVLFLLHPKQPLSLIATLIESEISSKESGKAPLEVTFHGAEEGIMDTAATSSETPSSTPSTKSQQHQKASSSSSSSTHHQWAQATELGDFVQEAAKDRKFIIAIKEHNSHDPALVKIRVPSFEERTLFLRRRLVQVTKEMQSLLDIKSECDTLALQGARRMAVAGFGGLLAYWGGVYFLTFHVYGWDLMEPVTYLTGLTGLMGGYLWFLFNQKEISYRSVFEMSSSKRREQLYDAKGFDRYKWKDLIDEGTELRRAIKKIAIDYTVDWSMHNELEDAKAADEIKKHEKGKFGKQAVDGEDDQQKSGEDLHAARLKS